MRTEFTKETKDRNLDLLRKIKELIQLPIFKGLIGIEFVGDVDRFSSQVELIGKDCLYPKNLTITAELDAEKQSVFYVQGDEYYGPSEDDLCVKGPWSKVLQYFKNLDSQYETDRRAVEIISKEIDAEISAIENN